MSATLKRCPFCNSSNVAQGASRGRISVWCFCGAQGPSIDFPDTCIDPVTPIRECHAAWNRRTDGWQGIATAPRDGSEIIARTKPGFLSFSCFWLDGQWVHYDHDDGLIAYLPTEWVQFPQAVPA